MTVRNGLLKVLLHEDVNFLLTNRIPRRIATKVVGRVSKVKHPIVRVPSIAAWKFFAGADLSDASQRNYASLHHAFTRSLLPGARAVDPDPAVIVAPCDAIVGATGTIAAGRAYQAKGLSYRLHELIGDGFDDARFEGGTFVTLRLTAAMYHRFHAPDDLTIDRVRYISGDTWNVNPIALKRVERLFCRNERGVIAGRLGAGGTPFLMVAVAAILVAGIRFHFLDAERLLRTGGARTVELRSSHERGEELGWFEHGSTILLFLPPGYDLLVAEGERLTMGRALARARIDQATVSPTSTLPRVAFE